jgi:hypothetical protein
VRWVSDIATANASKKRDALLISTGGEDKCVFQWKVSGSEDSEKEAKGAATSAGAGDADDAEEDLFEGGVSGGDEFMAVKPWKGAIHPPTAWTPSDKANQQGKANLFVAALGDLSANHRLLRNPPGGSVTDNNDIGDPKVLEHCTYVHDLAKKTFQRMSESGVTNCTAPDIDELELEWVHGLRCYDCRNNVRYVNPTVAARQSPANFILYHAAALGIMLDPAKKTQKYFRGHTDDVRTHAVFFLF